jgi:hypothetical protein
MIVWLWDAGSAHGMTDDESRAQEATTAFMNGTGTDNARVERALLVTGVRTLTLGYLRTGAGWLAQRRGDDRIRWTPLQTTPEAELPAAPRAGWPAGGAPRR